MTKPMIFVCASFMIGKAQAVQIISIADEVDKVLPGVVNIQTRDRDTSTDGRQPLKSFFNAFLLPGQLITPNTAKSLGSGFFYFNKQTIVTNYHVIKDAEAIFVASASPKRRVEASLKGYDEKADIAVLIIPQNSIPEAKALNFAPSDNERIGSGVFAIGNPFGYGHTVTSGILSAKGRIIGEGPYDDCLQTDAAINPGNSGGPLFNSKGKIIGINRAIAEDARGISFALSSEIALPILKRILRVEKNTRPWLGILTESLKDEDGQYGLVIQNLVKNSPATKAELKIGDIILAINGKKIDTLSTAEKILNTLSSQNPVTFTIFRNSKARTVTLIPEESSTKTASIRSPHFL